MILKTISDPKTTAEVMRRATAERDEAYRGGPCESNLRKPFVRICRGEYVIVNSCRWSSERQLKRLEPGYDNSTCQVAVLVFPR